MKIIPLLMPVSEEMIHEDTPMDERGKRAELSKSALDVTDVLLKKHPEVKIVMAFLYTPPGPREETPGQPFDWNHTCIASQDGVTQADLKEFVDLVLPSLIKLRIELENNPFMLEPGGTKQ